MSRTQIISSKAVSRIIDRLAFQIIERNQGSDSLEIFGIVTAGAYLANVLAARISSIENRSLRVHSLDVTRFRDDIETADPDVAALSVDLTDKNVVLVDDVLFTGRTARAALNAVVSLGRPTSVQLAVLIDRGHREYPMQPDFTGRRIPTKHRERIVVDEKEGFAVFLEE